MKFYSFLAWNIYERVGLLKRVICIYRIINIYGEEPRIIFGKY